MSSDAMNVNANAGLWLEVVNMGDVAWSGQVRVVTVPGAEGGLGILRGHTPLLTRLREGFVHIETLRDEQLDIYVSGGFVEIQPHGVTVLADTAVRGADLDAARAEAARQEASSQLHSALAELDHGLIQAELARATAQWGHELRKLKRS